MKKARLHPVIAAPQSRVTLAESLDEFLLALQVAQRSPATLIFYGKNVTRFIAWCAESGLPTQLAKLQTGHIRLWLSHLQSRPSVSDISVQSYYRAVRAWLNWCEKEEMIPQSPFGTGRLPCPKARERIKPSYSVDDIHALLSACAHGQSQLRDRAIILLLLDTGIRESELCGLRLADLDRGRVKVLGKGAKERFAYVGPQTEKALRDYVRRERCPMSDDPDVQATLFLGRKGPLTPNGLGQIIKRRAALAGVAAPGVHKFRHTFAKLWVTDGGSLHTLQAHLGHESPHMSMKYGKAFGQDLADAHQKHSPVERLGLGKKGKR